MGDSEEYDRLVWPLKISCQLFGVWPDREEVEGIRSARTLIPRFYQTLMIFLLVVTVMGNYAEVAIFLGEDMNETIEISLVASALSMGLFRIFIFNTNRKNVLYVVQIMRQDWIQSTYEEREVLREKCLLAYKLAKFFCFSVAATGIAFILMPILELNFMEGDHKKVLPYRGYFFFNNTVSPRFECTYIANSIIGLFGCSTIAGATSFSLIASIHGAAKFALVQKNLKAINMEDWISNEKLGNWVRQHQECIRFAEKAEEIINFLALAQFIISTGLMCFAGFQITTMLEDRTRMMKYSSFLNAAVTELFIFSYGGQSLKTESEGVADAAYTSNWIGNSKSTNIQLIIMRCRKPCVITAGKFYDMSLESFLKVLSSSFSYFTVLLAMKEE